MNQDQTKFEPAEFHKKVFGGYESDEGIYQIPVSDTPPDEIKRQRISIPDPLEKGFVRHQEVTYSLQGRSDGVLQYYEISSETIREKEDVRNVQIKNNKGRRNWLF